MSHAIRELTSYSAIEEIYDRWMNSVVCESQNNFQPMGFDSLLGLFLIGSGIFLVFLLCIVTRVFCDRIRKRKGVLEVRHKSAEGLSVGRYNIDLDS